MTLTCICDETSDPEWFYDPPCDYTVAPARPNRRRRCRSCRTPIEHGAICASFRRWRGPLGKVEATIRGEEAEITLAPWWMCETCADLYFSLSELGFCIDIAQSMQTLVREYADIAASHRRTNLTKEQAKSETPSTETHDTKSA